MFENWFKESSAARAAIEAASTEEQRDIARKNRRALREEIDRACGDDITKRAFSDYCSARNNGNLFMDINSVLWSKEVPAFVERDELVTCEVADDAHVTDGDAVGITAARQ